MDAVDCSGTPQTLFLTKVPSHNKVPFPWLGTLLFSRTLTKVLSQKSNGSFEWLEWLQTKTDGLKSVDDKTFEAIERSVYCPNPPKADCGCPGGRYWFRCYSRGTIRGVRLIAVSVRADVLVLTDTN